MTWGNALIEGKTVLRSTKPPYPRSQTYRTRRSPDEPERDTDLDPDPNHSCPMSDLTDSSSGITRNLPLKTHAVATQLLP